MRPAPGPADSPVKCQSKAPDREGETRLRQEDRARGDAWRHSLEASLPGPACPLALSRVWTLAAENAFENI